MVLEDGRHVLEADEVEAPPTEENVPRPGALLTTAAMERLMGGQFEQNPDVRVALGHSLTLLDLPLDAESPTFTQVKFRRLIAYNIPPYGNKAYIWERMP